MIEEVTKKDINSHQELQKLFPQKTVDFFYQEENPFRKLYKIEEDDSKIVGYLILDLLYERMELIQIEVLKEKQNQGYGKKMLDYMLELARESKVQNITLEVRMDNEKAIHLYKKYGFQEVGIRKNYYHDQDGILMERKMM